MASYARNGYRSRGSCDRPITGAVRSITPYSRCLFDDGIRSVLNDLPWAPNPYMLPMRLVKRSRHGPVQLAQHSEELAHSRLVPAGQQPGESTRRGGSRLL